MKVVLIWAYGVDSLHTILIRLRFLGSTGWAYQLMEVLVDKEMIARHIELQRRVLAWCDKCPSWMLSYDIRSELKAAGLDVQTKN